MPTPTTKPIVPGSTSGTKPYDPIPLLLAQRHPPPTLAPQYGEPYSASWMPQPPPGWAVRLLCRLLAAQGVAEPERGWLDLAVTPPSVYNEALAGLVESFQRDRQLPVDGVCGPETWAWLGCRDPRDLGEVALAYARADAYACAREIDGNNRGEWVKRYLGWDGKDAEWCAGAATTWVNRARARLGLPAWDWGSNRLSSSALVRYASKHGRLYVLPGQSWAWERQHGLTATTALAERKGSLCIVRGGRTHWRHTTLLDRVEGGRAYVIEGNVRPLAWLTDAVWRMLGKPAGIVRPGSYPLSQVVFVRTI